MEKDKINAFPRKRLFIDTLTQDVKAETCILDLIDNSVDSYIRNKINEKRKIDLTINKDKFEIFDNCGGIEKNFLKSNVFRFGAENLNREHPTLGMYGIGLKRSIFKLGNDITFETDDGQDYSLIKLNVENWESKDEHDWEIPFDTEKSNLKKGELPYTRIIVEDLHLDISEKFGLVSFNNDILITLQRVYCLIMKESIDFNFNEKKIAPDPLIVPIGKDYNPNVLIEKYNEIDIHIICFIDPSKGTRLANAVNIRGWNIFCNNRLILTNDTSPTTGWTGFEDKKNKNDKGILPKYHPIYNEFRGIVFLKSNNPFNLPMNTSKDNLKTEDKTYHYILEKMISTARPVIDYLNSKYTKEKEAEDEIEETIEQTVDEEFKPTDTIQADEINEPSNFSAPQQTSIKKDDNTKISYSRKKKIVDKVKSYLDVNSNKEVGEKTFDYFVDREDIS